MHQRKAYGCERGDGVGVGVWSRTRVKVQRCQRRGQPPHGAAQLNGRHCFSGYGEKWWRNVGGWGWGGSRLRVRKKARLSSHCRPSRGNKPGDPHVEVEGDGSAAAIWVADGANIWAC